MESKSEQQAQAKASGGDGGRDVLSQISELVDVESAKAAIKKLYPDIDSPDESAEKMALESQDTVDNILFCQAVRSHLLVLKLLVDSSTLQQSYDELMRTSEEKIKELEMELEDLRAQVKKDPTKTMAEGSLMQQASGMAAS